MPDEIVTEIKAADVQKITAAFEPEEEKEKLFKKMNVVGVGVGTNVKGGVDTGEPCVKVLVSQKLLPDLLADGDKIDPKIGPYNTDVEEVGELLAGYNPDGEGEMIAGQEVNVLDGEEISTFVDQEAATQLLRERVRPVEGGYSVGHYRITAGTYATAVYDSRAYPGIPPRYYALSNCHVLARCGFARIGDPILQPGPADGGAYPRDVIARLSRWVPIRYGGPANYVDAAIAEGPFHWLDREIYWIGYVKGVRGGWPSIGEILQKTGRTTNYTTGRVTTVNATVNIGGYVGGWARFERQIVTANMSAGGDSGSLVLDLNENAIGLLFAGSSARTIMNHIVYVQALLAIRIV